MQTVLLLLGAAAALVIGGTLAVGISRYTSNATGIVLGAVVGVTAAVLVTVPQGDTIPDQYEPAIEAVLVATITLVLAVVTIARARR